MVGYLVVVHNIQFHSNEISTNTLHQCSDVSKDTTTTTTTICNSIIVIIITR